MNWLGLDIGGANIKAASTEGDVLSQPFRFWVEHERLKESLTEIIGRFPGFRVAATMTAELADCFASRKDGVQFIVDCLVEVCDDLGFNPPVFVGTDLKFRTAEEAKRLWLKTAASNWAVMASFTGRYLPDQSGVVVDMGSTTTDIIPVSSGQVAAKGKTDSERLHWHELVYVGSDRTPVCGVVNTLTLGSVQMGVANELFATVSDAMLLCGYAAEDPSRCDTADGRSRTIGHAAQRICRMVCEDAETVGMEAAKDLAAQILSKVDSTLHAALTTQFAEVKFEHMIITGSGANYLKQRLSTPFCELGITLLSSHVDASIDSVAPAWAVAVLASEHCK